MILYRNRLVFGLIKSVIGTVFTIVYKVLALFNLQLTLLVALLGVILYFVGVFDQNPMILIVFYTLVIISIGYAILATIKKLLGIDKKVKRSKGAQIISTDPDAQKEKEESNLKIEEKPTVTHDAPTYFKVKNHPDYVMAEYGDRYELFKKTDGGLKKVRTDFK